MELFQVASSMPGFGSPKLRVAVPAICLAVADIDGGAIANAASLGVANLRGANGLDARARGRLVVRLLVV